MSNKPRIFVAFAMEDESIRDLFVGQARNENSPFEFTDLSVKERYESGWKSKVQTRIRGCQGVIAIISKNSQTSKGQKWEIECAKYEGIPIRGLWAYQDDHTRIPGIIILNWKWETINNWMENL